LKSTSFPTLELESTLWAGHYRLVCGVDEVGRGPLAGPVVAAAVIFSPQIDLIGTGLVGLNDSKKLSPKKRLELLPLIRSHALGVGVGLVSVEEIDEINIRQAALLAMTKAVAQISLPVDYVLVDGRDWPPGIQAPGESVIRGDGKSVTIAAASIVAKVHRDKIMSQLAQLYPDYGWERNRGYPTQEHRNALLSHGITPHHRTSFAPVKKAMG
jgi:ribonuclease HII